MKAHDFTACKFAEEIECVFFYKKNQTLTIIIPKKAISYRHLENKFNGLMQTVCRYLGRAFFGLNLHPSSGSVREVLGHQLVGRQ